MGDEITVNELSWVASFSLGFVHSMVASFLWWVCSSFSDLANSLEKKFFLIPIPEDKISFKFKWKEKLWKEAKVIAASIL